MKKSEILRLRTLKLVAKSLIVLVLLAVVAFAGVYSWFRAEPTTDASGLSVKATTPDGLEFFFAAPNNSSTVQSGYAAINTWLTTYNTNHANDEGFQEKTWHQGELNIDFSDPEFGFMSDLFLCETTSDGYTFKIPSLIQYGEIAYVDTSGTMENATPNVEYVSFDLYFRSKSPNTVQLLYNSKIEPTGTPGTTDDDAMKHAAIGAVRLSAYNGFTRELLWIPGPCVWFDGTANNGEGQLYVNQTTFPANRGNVYYDGSGYALYAERTVDHAYYNASGTRTVLSNTPLNDILNNGNIVASTGGNYQLGSSAADNVSLVTLDNTYYDSATGYYYNRVRINLWIEGEDAESRLKFVGGKFNLTLNFDVAS